MRAQQRQHETHNADAENHGDLLIATKNVLIEKCGEPDCRSLQDRKTDNFDRVRSIRRGWGEHLGRRMMERPEQRNLAERYMGPVVDEIVQDDEPQGCSDDGCRRQGSWRLPGQEPNEHRGHGFRPKQSDPGHDGNIQEKREEEIDRSKPAIEPRRRMAIETSGKGKLTKRRGRRASSSFRKYIDDPGQGQTGKKVRPGQPIGEVGEDPRHPSKGFHKIRP